MMGDPGEDALASGSKAVGQLDAAEKQKLAFVHVYDDEYTKNEMQ